MSFAFRDNVGEFDIFKVYTPFNLTGRKQVAQAMGDVWTSFARDGGLRCRIYARVFLWMPLFRDYGNEPEYKQWCETLGCQIPAAAQRPKLEV
jgi:hypothetical protein